jgi:hypothetical protein
MYTQVRKEIEMSINTVCLFVKNLEKLFLIQNGLEKHI